VAASEIEAVLESHPAVHQALVVPIPHPILNEVPAAFVELKRGAHCRAAELLRLCASDLARFKRPAHLWFIEAAELPLTETGKVRKAELRELALKRLPAIESSGSV
jgi:fatty-acyl-CoA synthase